MTPLFDRLRIAWTAFVRELRLDVSFRELPVGRGVTSFRCLPSLPIQPSEG